MHQRIALSAVVLAGAALLACPPAASASSDPSVPGTPGTPNCVGQTNAAIARDAGPNGPLGSYAPGLGNVARFSGLTVAEAQALVRAYCEK